MLSRCGIVKTGDVSSDLNIVGCHFFLKKIEAPSDQAFYVPIQASPLGC